jgi:hypothetical protein
VLPEAIVLVKATQVQLFKSYGAPVAAADPAAVLAPSILAAYALKVALAPQHEPLSKVVVELVIAFATEASAPELPVRLAWMVVPVTLYPKDLEHQIPCCWMHGTQREEAVPTFLVALATACIPAKAIQAPVPEYCVEVHPVAWTKPGQEL